MRTSEFLELALELALDWQGLREWDLCPRCGGAGRRAYGSTATWRGGVGGQRVTAGVCDACWGSGSKSQQGVNLKLLSAMVTEEQMRKLVGCDS